MRKRFFTISALSLAGAAVLCAVSPTSVDTRRNPGDAVFSTRTPQSGEVASTDEGETGILMLPGAPEPPAPTRTATVPRPAAPASMPFKPPRPAAVPRPATAPLAVAPTIQQGRPAPLAVAVGVTQMPRAAALLAPETPKAPVQTVRAAIVAPKPSPALPAPPPVLPAPPAAAPAPQAATAPPAALPPALLPREPQLPASLVKDSAPFLQHQLGRWTLADARRLFGEALRHRPAYDDRKQVDGAIYAFSDPTKRYREFELEFSRKTGLLRSAFIYPWKMRWDEARKVWTGSVSSAAASNGRTFYSFSNRRLDVLVDRAGYIVSLGLY